MNCSDLNVECFYTELEKVKTKIDPVKDKINWDSLSMKITLDEDVLDYYKSDLNWIEIGSRLSNENKELFEKYLDLDLYKFSDLKKYPMISILLKYWDDIPTSMIEISIYSTDDAHDILKRMIQDKRFEESKIVENIFNSSYAIRYSDEFRKLAVTHFGAEISEKIWKKIENNESVSSFDYWFDQEQIRNGYNPSLETHRKAVLERLTRRQIERYQDIFDFSTKELIDYRQLWNLKGVLVYMFTGNFLVY